MLRNIDYASVLKSHMGKAYFVWECYEHEGMARPDMEVVRIEQKRRFAIPVLACRHLQFDIFVPDIFLLIIHSKKTSVSGRVGGNKK